ncbi:dihydroneopterin aldolase [Schaalia sp. Marseille-Q2122]|uniref:dihydroneopterin aldolase n=1 Tax=Schaalia sp. Marseille-Q2122 TaxID=2736604 RepID=UPI00158E8831|nr:dihydroneopterin aldolase [Schaalia sp. Marseille-Q2122]
MSAKLDIITLRGLTAEGIHGVFEFEHAAPQPFVIDIALWVDTTDAITSDDIADTVSYADVANDVVGVVEGPPAHLIETLAQRISDVLLANPRVEGVEVTVHKPKAPLEQEFTDVAITVRRGHTPGTILRIRDITVVDGKVAPEADEPLVSFGGPDEARPPSSQKRHVTSRPRRLLSRMPLPRSPR